MDEVWGVFFTDNHTDYIRAAFETEEEAVSYMEEANEQAELGPDDWFPPHFVDTIDREEVDFDLLGRGFVQQVVETSRWVTMTDADIRPDNIKPVE
jgi:hypothetical protein